jgi:hypothetical protein
MAVESEVQAFMKAQENNLLQTRLLSCLIYCWVSSQRVSISCNCETERSA